MWKYFAQKIRLAGFANLGMETKSSGKCVVARVSNNLTMGDTFHPLGAQGAIIEKLSEFTCAPPGVNGHGLVLAHPSGAGKTYAYLAFIAEEIRRRNQSFDKAPIDTLKLTSSEEDVHKAAREVVQLLLRIFEERKGNVNYELSTRQFRTVKHAWLTLEPGKSIEYSTSELISAYSCGTTLLHSVFTKAVFERLELAHNGARVLVLCGGSGAELMGLKLIHNLNAKKLTVLDIFEWDGACEKIWGNAGNLDFQRIDLLRPDNHSRVATYVREADVVTLLYGLTELYDHHAEGAELLVTTVIHNLQPKSKFIVLDPTKTCYGKDRWVDTVASQAGARASTQYKSIKLVMPERYVKNSEAATWIYRMGLKLNEDVKLSMNVWYRVLTPQVSGPSFRAQPNQRYDCICCYSLKAVVYGVNFLKRLGCSEEVLTLGSISGAETPDEQRAALFHLRATVSHYQRAGMSFILLFTYRQVELYSNTTEFVQLLRDAGVVILDDLDLYFPSSSQKKIRKKIRLLDEVLPQESKRVAVCGDPAKLHLCTELCNSSVSLSSNGNAQTEIQISRCLDPNCCNGVLSTEHAVTVKYRHTILRQSNDYSLKEFERHVGPFAPLCRDVIFEGFGKFSQAKRDEICARALGKLAHVGKSMVLNRLVVSVEDGRTTRSRKLSKAEVRLHFHEPCVAKPVPVRVPVK